MDEKIVETAREHLMRTKHSVVDGLDLGWKCLVCKARGEKTSKS